MQQYGLIGYPLGHSFSKKYFTDKFEKEGLEDCFFELFALENVQELPALLLTHPSLCGLAVTIPYKESVLPFLHNITPFHVKDLELLGCLPKNIMLL